MRFALLAMPVLLSLAACVTEATGSGPAAADPTSPEDPLVSDETAAEPDAATAAPVKDAGPQKEAGDASPEAAAQVDASVFIDGLAVAVTGTKFVTQTLDGVPEYYMQLALATSSGSHPSVSVNARSVSDWCGRTPYNAIVYTAPDGQLFSPPYTFDGVRPIPFHCGLDVTALPTAIGKVMSGSFSGTLAEPGATHQLTVTFSVARTE